MQFIFIPRSSLLKDMSKGLFEVGDSPHLREKKKLKATSAVTGRNDI